MVIKLLPFLLLLFACGKEVNISTKKMEYNSGLSDGLKTESDGVLIRGTTDQISSNGSTLTVSIYSSHLALEFIAARAVNEQYPVRFKGEEVNGKIVLEIIETR